MVEVVYLLCGVASALCMLLLLRAYFRSRVKLLLWSGLCFGGLALNNALLVADFLVYPNVNLAVFRNLSAASGIFVLVYSLVWDSP